MSHPLVSIITPAIAARRELLANRCFPSVRDQTYPNVEHLVISDGEEIELPWWMSTSVRYFQLGRNFREFYGNTWGAYPRLIGTHLARGQYIGYVDDDDELLPQHVEKLVEFIEQTGADFVHSLFRREMPGGEPLIIGESIEAGRIGTPCVLHRIECIKKWNWGGGGDFEDFELFSNWNRLGLKSAHLPEVTILVHK